MALTGFAALVLSAPANGDDGRTPSANIAVTETRTEDAPTVAPLAGRVIRRHSDGLFYVEALASNGQTIRFVVDTGATVVVLNREDAARLGMPFESLENKGSMRTVGGPSDMRWAKIDRLDMAGKRIEKISAAVVSSGLPVSLMGQNALEQLGTVTLRGDTMTIH